MAQHHGDRPERGHHHHPDVFESSDFRPMPPCATPEQMTRIIDYLSGVSFDSDRLKAAQLIVSICPILSHDLVRIINLFSFDDKRMEVLIAAFPYCPDPENFWFAIEQLTFSSNKETVCERTGYWY